MLICGVASTQVEKWSHHKSVRMIATGRRRSRKQSGIDEDNDEEVAYSPSSQGTTLSSEVNLLPH
jgi:hypothetical protein